MKFMKLGSKPDSFQNDGDNARYVATELASDIVVIVGDVKFYLHKFPLLSKSAKLQKLTMDDDNHNNDICIHDIPGGPMGFEICAKFSYGMTVTLNAYNVVLARCAAEYLEMYETVEKGNLVYKIDVFLTTSVFKSWKDSIIVLQSTKSFLPWSEELKLVGQCVDSISSKASMDSSKVEWSYTYNRKKLPSENWNGTAVRKQTVVPKDWWVEDLCDLPVDLFKLVIIGVKTKGKSPPDVIGEALVAFAMRRLQSLGAKNNKYVVETLVWLLPKENGCVPCGFLLRLLQAAIPLECGENVIKELTTRIGRQLEEATVSELLISAPAGEVMIHHVGIVGNLLEEFVKQDHGTDELEFEVRSLQLVSESSKTKVAKVIDGYLAEISRDTNLTLDKFMDIAQLVSGFPRESHDGLYRAIDMFLKEHPTISKIDRKRICRLMDCKKLSGDACVHAIQNERLPMRVVVQVLFFEQIRSTSSSSSLSGGCITPDLPSKSYGSSRSATTNTEDQEWDAIHNADALKGKLASVKMTANKMRGAIMSKLWSGKDRDSENSSSETSESPCSSSNTEAEETKSTTR